MKTKKHCIYALLLMFGSLRVLQAQDYVVDAQFTSQAVGDSTYNYTITLNNDGSSSNPIGTFWFAWVPDYYYGDLLTSAPNSTGAPAGWSGSAQGFGPYYDGYSILFTADDTIDYLLPGNSLTFQFNSTDTPADLSGNSASYYHSDLPMTYSYVYSSGPQSDPGFAFAVQPTATPEPASFAILALAGLSFIGRRNFKSQRS